MRALSAANLTDADGALGGPPSDVRLWHKADIDLDADCPLSGAKRTSLIRSLMSANDPKRTFVLRGGEHNRGHWPAFASASSTPDLVTPSISLAMSSSRIFHR